MPKLTESFLRQRSAELLVEKIAGATVFDKDQEQKIPLFNPKEVVFGSVLGKGGFCTVTTLKKVNIADDEENKKNRQPSKSEIEFFTVSQDREFISDNFIREGKHRYAIKKLTPGLYSSSGDPQHFVCGVIDLAMEVKFLSVLRHPNIIKMRARATVDHCSKDFFILLDRLDMTLGKKISVWKKEMPYGFGAVIKKRKQEFFCERLMVGHDICSAISHLHENKIIYRDLKPDNIGFDVRGDVKVFDFGLATEMVPSRKVEGMDTYMLTKDTGSPRYMAPEVFRGIPYNEKCDVYSFALILWSCLDLSLPFSNYDLPKMASKVYRGKETPKINSKWSEGLKTLLINCWLRDFSKRQSSMDVVLELKKEIGEIDGDLIGQLDISNRTEKSINNLRL